MINRYYKKTAGAHNNSSKSFVTQRYGVTSFGYQYLHKLTTRVSYSTTKSSLRTNFLKDNSYYGNLIYLQNINGIKVRNNSTDYPSGYIFSNYEVCSF